MLNGGTRQRWQTDGRASASRDYKRAGIRQARRAGPPPLVARHLLGANPYGNCRHQLNNVAKFKGTSGGSTQSNRLRMRAPMQRTRSEWSEVLAIVEPHSCQGLCSGPEAPTRVINCINSEIVGVAVG